MARSKGGAVNAETVTTTVYGVDPFGAAQADAIAAVAQAANAGRSGGRVTINPVEAFHGDAVVAVQHFLGEGQLERNLGALKPTNNPVTNFHQTSSSPLLDDPVMAAFADQLSRGVM